MTTELVRFLILTQLASTLYMTGVTWLVQIVHYPLRASCAGSAYEQRYTSSITWVVAPPMLIEGGSALLLLMRIPSAWAGTLWIGLALLIAIWISTAFVQIPCHQILAKSFDSTAHRRLTSTNWLKELRYGRSARHMLGWLGRTYATAFTGNWMFEKAPPTLTAWRYSMRMAIGHPIEVLSQ